MIIEQILVTGMSVFCYLIADDKTKEGMLVDPAGDYDKIFSVVDRHKVTIKWVINTHGHFDHTSGNDYVIKKTNAQLMIHELDARKMGSMLNSIMARLVGGKGSPDPVAFVKDGDIVNVGSIPVKVIHTPGHTEGGICLYVPGNVFTGDTLFTEGFGRTDFAGGSHAQLIESIKNKILTLPDTTVIWPGHHYGRYPTSTVKEQKRMY